MPTALVHPYSLAMRRPVQIRPQLVGLVSLALLTLTAQGCVSSEQAGEASKTQCNDDDDNDNDGMTDCDDPGCRGTFHCLQSAQGGGGGIPVVPSIGASDAGGAHPPPPARDASIRHDGGTNHLADASDPQHTGDAGIDSGVHSAVPDGAVPSPCPRGICPSGQVCEEGICVPGAKLGTTPLNVHLTIDQAAVPLWRLEFGEQIFYDPGGSLAGWRLGGAGPDPYVVILLNPNGPEPQEIWASSVVEDNFTGLWDDPGIDVELTGDDELVFEARDYDAMRNFVRIYEPMFSCSPGFPANISDTPREISCGDTTLWREQYILGTVRLAESSSQ